MSEKNIDFKNEPLAVTTQLEEREQTTAENMQNEEQNNEMTGKKMLIQQLSELKKELAKLRKDLRAAKIKTYYIKRTTVKLSEQLGIKKKEYFRSTRIYRNLRDQIMKTTGHRKQELA